MMSTSSLNYQRQHLARELGCQEFCFWLDPINQIEAGTPDGRLVRFDRILCDWRTDRGGRFKGAVPIILEYREHQPSFLAALFGAGPSYSVAYDDRAILLEMRFMVAMSGGRMLTEEEIHELHQQTARIEGRPADERILLARSVRALQEGCYFSNGKIVTPD